MDIEQRIIELSDEKYRQFQLKLMPGVEPQMVVGVRVPLLRSLAKEIIKAGEGDGFIEKLPHSSYDAYNLHGFLLCEIKDYDRCIKEVDRFLPYVNNWATCDLLSPKVFKKNTDRLIIDIKRWLSSKETYTIRFGIEMLMSHFLDEHFSQEYLEMVAKIRSEEYYVNMMIAWYFATALTKQYDATLPYIENGKLDKWTHNKTIQKAIESYRISGENKEYLRTLKIK